MEFKKYISEKANYAAANRVLRFFVVVVGLAVIFNSLVTYYLFTSNKVILVPPQLSTQVFVSGKDASDEYLETVARYICQLAFNYNPGNVRGQLSDLLKLVSPESFPVYQKAFYDLADRVEAGGVSSSFFVQKVTVKKTDRTMVVHGILNQWTRDKKFITDEPKRYIIHYSIRSGLFYIVDLKEYKEGGSQ